MDTPLFKSLVGSLRYLTCMRPDILYAVKVFSQYTEHPTITHLKVTKRILCYIEYITNLGLYCSVFYGYKLLEYIDSDWGRDVDNPKSTNGFIFYIVNTSFTCKVEMKTSWFKWSDVCKPKCPFFFYLMENNISFKF